MKTKDKNFKVPKAKSYLDYLREFSYNETYKSYGIKTFTGIRRKNADVVH